MAICSDGDVGLRVFMTITALLQPWAWQRALRLQNNLANQSIRLAQPRLV